mgnify:CR=1 FL=1
MDKKDELQSLRNLEDGSLAGNIACFNRNEINEETMLKYEKNIIEDAEAIKQALIEKQKFIEICINKQVDFSVLKLAKEVEDYNYECPFTEGLLTEEEFNFLKKVVGNENK